MIYFIIGIIILDSIPVKSQTSCDDLNSNEIINSFKTCLSDLNACKKDIYKVTKYEPGFEPAGNGFDYYITNEFLTWQAARNECQSKGGDLAHANIRNLTYRMTILNGQALNVWIGLTDIINESMWKWIDNSLAESSDTLWADGEPNNFNDNEDCGFINLHYMADDNPCEYERRALCEKMS